MNNLMSFFNSGSVWTYLLIFAGKILEVSISTLRIMLINRGERVKGVIAAFFEYSLWIFITGTVLTNFQSDPLKIVVLIAAFATGNFAGSWLEEKLAFGICTITVYFSTVDEARTMAKKLRDNGHAVTLMDGEGIGEEKREIIKLITRRKFTPNVISIISKENPSAMITIANTASVRGGFFKVAERRSPVTSFINARDKFIEHKNVFLKKEKAEDHKNDNSSDTSE